MWSDHPLLAAIPPASSFAIDEAFLAEVKQAASVERVAALPETCRSTGAAVSIAYHTFGSPQDPCVLLVMGLNSQSVAWDHRFCQLLASAGPFFVVRYDNRDCGLSTKMDQTWVPKMLHYALPSWMWKGRKWSYPPYTLSDMARDGIGLLDALHVDKAHVVGVSMGGMIAQLMAIEHPSRVLTLTSIMSSVGKPDQAHASLTTKMALLRQPVSLSPADVAAFRVWWVQRMVGLRPIENKNQLFTTAWFGASRMTYRNGLSRHTAAIMHAPCRAEALGALKIPALVIHGDADVLVPLENGYDTFKALTSQCNGDQNRVRLVVKEKMGHFILPEDFEWMVQEIVQTASSLSSP